jgi:hypothetical protein
MKTCKGIKKDLVASKSSSKEVDIFPWMTVAALELIGEAGLGYSFSSFTGERNEYNIAIKSVMFVFNKLGSLYLSYFCMQAILLQSWPVHEFDAVGLSPRTVSITHMGRAVYPHPRCQTAAPCCDDSERPS